MEDNPEMDAEEGVLPGILQGIAEKVNARPRHSVRRAGVPQAPAVEIWSEQDQEAST